MNPILSTGEFIPDVEARVFEDGKIYLYGSCDKLGNTEYCSREYYVFVSEDLHVWEKYGPILNTETESFRHMFGTGMLYAPDCIEKDGKYYLYFCMENGMEGVAVSDCPLGPFENPQIVGGVEQDGIDPAVFVDEDGEAYYFWGQFHLRGARLQPNMKEIDESTRKEEILTEELHGFHEGASIRKRNGIYYLLYTDISTGRATCLSYATSKNPLGPYQKQGILIDNAGCDPMTWNNHGSIQVFQNQWYVFYHRSSQNSKYNRRVCVEKICFDQNGQLSSVKMTTQGQEETLDARKWLDGGRCCLLSESACVRTEYRDGIWRDEAVQIGAEGWLLYRFLEFHNENRFCICMENEGESGKVELWIEETKKKIGEFLIDRKFIRKEIQTETDCICGQFTLLLRFRGEGMKVRIGQFRFKNGA